MLTRNRTHAPDDRKGLNSTRKRMQKRSTMGGTGVAPDGEDYATSLLHVGGEQSMGISPGRTRINILDEVEAEPMPSFSFQEYMRYVVGKNRSQHPYLHKLKRHKNRLTYRIGWFLVVLFLLWAIFTYYNWPAARIVQVDLLVKEEQPRSTENSFELQLGEFKEGDSQVKETPKPRRGLQLWMDRTERFEQARHIPSKVMDAVVDLFGQCSARDTLWNETQLCCDAKLRSDEMKTFCLPGLVIIGAQKGGTTALHSYLLFHPDLAASRRKELHTFDIPWHWSEFKYQFKDNFSPNKVLDSKIAVVNFESTPSYTASPFACPRMAKVLPPSTRYVMILRDPVDRVWSEIQMKQRRVEAQDEFLALFNKYAKQLRTCLLERMQQIDQGRDGNINADEQETENRGDALKHIKHRTEKNRFRGDETPRQKLSRSLRKGSIPQVRHLIECLRNNGAKELVDNGRVKQFFNKPLAKIDSQNSDFVHSCFEETNGVARWLSSCLKKIHFLGETNPQVTQILYTESEEIKRTCLHTYQIRSQLEKRIASYDPPSPEPIWTKRDYCSLQLFVSLCPACSYIPFSHDVVFLGIAKNRQEQNLYDCVDRCLRAKDQPSGSNGKTFQCRFPAFSWGSIDDNQLDEPMEQMPDCSGPWCTCFPRAKVMSDISRNFLWRGMYHIHLQHCLRFIPPEQILVIENDELRRNPNETLNRVFRFAGLSPHDYSSISYDAAYEAFNKIYPNFEQVSGWSPNGTTSKLDPNIQSFLSDFYHEPNQRLFELIGKTYEWK